MARARPPEAMAREIAACTPDQPTGHMDTFIDRINNAADRIAERRNDLKDLADRLIGPVPTEAQDEPEPIKANSAFDRMDLQLNKLEHIIRQTAEQLERLNVL